MSITKNKSQSYPFYKGDTVITGVETIVEDVDDDTKKFTIPKGTKAIVISENNNSDYDKGVRLFFGFKNRQWDFWSLDYKLKLCRKVLIEKTIVALQLSGHDL